jgi:hypothetical protein
MASGLIAGILAFLAFVGGHLAAMHRRPDPSRMKAMFRAYAWSLPVPALLLAAMHSAPHWRAVLDGSEHPALAWLCAYVCHLLLFLFFVECFYHVERSVTLRFLMEILEAPGERVRLAELMGRYSVDDMIRRRLDVMQTNGLVTHHADRWRIAPKGRRLAAAMAISCWIFRSKPQNARL